MCVCVGGGGGGGLGGAKAPPDFGAKIIIRGVVMQKWAW